MAQDEDNRAAEAREMLFLVSGVALVVFGTGLVVTYPPVRKFLAVGLSAILPELTERMVPDLSVVGSDVQRYMKLRSM